MEPVKFIALDPEDLEVVSTHLQDAQVKVADVMWRPKEKRLVVALNRFDWLAAECTKPELRRCRSALRFERVTSCKCRSVNPHGKDDVILILCKYTAEKDGLVKAGVTGFEGKQEAKDKLREKLPIDTEFSFKWKVKDDAATLDEVKGEKIEPFKSLLEGEFGKKK